jgi:Domain of unknown function (DUF5664)
MDNTFQIKDSGKREQYDSGMVRDTAENKSDYTMVLDGPMFERWAIHLVKGAIKYAKRNWMKASGDAEYNRFKESALRHFLQWFRGERDEDHAAAVFFNINGAEYVQEKIKAIQKDLKDDQRGDTVVYKVDVLKEPTSFLREDPRPVLLYSESRIGRNNGI